MRMSTLLNEVRNFELDEGFSPKEIKMAIGIASDPRYAKGNMTGAVNAIEKMKKGLSKHPQVAAVLKRQNENLDEAKFSNDMIDKLKKTYEPLKGKKVNPTPLMKIFDKIDSNKDGLEQLYKADIPFVSMMAMSRLMLKHNYKAADINKLGKIRREDFVLDEAINEMVMKYVLINMQNKVQGYASDKKDALDIAKRTKSTMHPIKKKITDKTLEKMNALAKTPKELQDLGIIDEGKAVSRAQQAAIAISKKERGEKPKNEKVDPADIDDFATDDDVKQADNNILMQLRKTISLRGMKDVKFLDNKKVKVKEPIARAVFDRYSKLRTSIEKQKFQTQIAKSYKDLLNALKK